MYSTINFYRFILVTALIYTLFFILFLVFTALVYTCVLLNKVCKWSSPHSTVVNTCELGASATFSWCIENATMGEILIFGPISVKFGCINSIQLPLKGLKLLNNSTFYHLKSLIALSIHAR